MIENGAQLAWLGVVAIVVGLALSTAPDWIRWLLPTSWAMRVGGVLGGVGAILIAAGSGRTVCWLVMVPVAAVLVWLTLANARDEVVIQATEEIRSDDAAE